MYSISGTNTALEKRQYIINSRNIIPKTVGVVIGPYGTFIPNNIIIEYNNALNHFNNINNAGLFRNICELKKYNQDMKTLVDFINKKMIADNANLLLRQYKNK